MGHVLSENSTVDPLCAEVWFNELRLVDFANKGGYAANARMVTKLADLATVTLSGNYQTIGFGAIDKKLNDTKSSPPNCRDFSLINQF